MNNTVSIKRDWVPALTYISGAIVVIVSVIATAINLFALAIKLI